MEILQDRTHRLHQRLSRMHPLTQTRCQAILTRARPLDAPPIKLPDGRYCSKWVKTEDECREAFNASLDDCPADLAARWDEKAQCCACEAQDCGKPCAKESDCVGWCIGCNLTFEYPPGFFYLLEHGRKLTEGYCYSNIPQDNGELACGCAYYLDEQRNQVKRCRD